MSLAKAALESSRTIRETANNRFIFLSPCTTATGYNLFESLFRDKRRSMTRYFTIFALLVLAPFSADAEVHLQKDGVRLSVTTLVDRVVFCISASSDLKISSEYGVEFKADRQNGRFWSEPLPKVVTGPPYYFILPLRIELKTRGNAQERPISLNLGACSSAANTCVPVTFEINAPMASQGVLVSDCSATNQGMRKSY
jgi:hypothetical protein